METDRQTSEVFLSAAANNCKEEKERGKKIKKEKQRGIDKVMKRYLFLPRIQMNMIRSMERQIGATKSC